MPRYPDSFIDLIRERVDLLELVSRQVTLKRQGSSWLGLCPFHNEKTPSFNVRPGKGFKCFGCGVGGDAFEFLMKLKGFGFNEAVEELAGMVGIPLPRIEQEDPQAIRQREARNRLLDLLSATREFYREQLAAPVGEQARHYLKERGVKPETIQRFGLGYAPLGWTHLLDRFGGGEAAGELLESAGLVTSKAPGEKRYDRFRNRLMFPIQDIKGRCVAFGGRILGPGEPKYLNSPETELFQKGKLLYGLEAAQEAMQKAGSALVVEGYMDRLALVEHGLENVVATLGTAMTHEHVRLLWQRTRKIIFCFDGDAAGEKAAWRGLEMVLDGLEADRHVIFLFFPSGEDPDQVVRREGAKGFEERIKRGITPMEFMIRKLGVGLDPQTPEGRAGLVHRARPLLEKVKDPLLRELYTETLSQRVHIPMHYARVETLRRPEEKSFRSQGSSGAKVPYKPYNVTSKVKQELRQPANKVASRNHEQALLALLLRLPRLVKEREEELSRLELEDRQLGGMLAELIEMGHEYVEAPASWPKKPFANREMSRMADAILASEEMTLELAEQEFDGCLISIHIQALRKERMRLMRQMDLEGDDDARLFKRCCALKLEEERVLGDKVAQGI
ncbi:MAG: DNA primase [Magnetococcus sp. YQC-5]